MSRYCRRAGIPKSLSPLLFPKLKAKGTRKSKFKSREKEALKILASSDRNAMDTVRSLTVEKAPEYSARDFYYNPKLKKPATGSQCNKQQLFQFLPTLKNLQSLSLDPKSLSLDPEDSWDEKFNTSHIPALMEATKHAPLRQLSLSINVEPKPNRVVTPGPTGLDTLCIRWGSEELSQNHKPGGVIDHLLAFITPSLASLSHLELYFSNWRTPVSNIFDLTSLKAAGENMRHFHLEATEQAGIVVVDNPIRIVAENFPKLTKLTMLDAASEWNDDYIDSLALLTRLKHLTLSPDLEKTEDWLNKDEDKSWYRRCFYRRFHATRKIVEKCPQLERCSWRHEPIDSHWNSMVHEFVVVDSPNHQGRVVTPVMQWWMLDRFKKELGGYLPEDMIKEKVFWEESRIDWEDNEEYNIIAT